MSREGEHEFLGTTITTLGNTYSRNDSEQKGFANNGSYPESDHSETPSEMEERLKLEQLHDEEIARRRQLDYAVAVKEKMDWDGTYHPGVDGSDLIQFTDGHLVVTQDWFENDKQNLIYSCVDRRLLRRGPRQLCHNCGWTTHNQVSPWGYTSRFKIKHLKGEYGLWEAGPEWFVRDEINNDWNGPTNDFIATNFIREKVPEVPLVELHRFGKKEDKYALTVMSRAKGVALRTIETQLTPEQEDILSEDLGGYINKWRQLITPRMQRADGKPLRDFIVRCNHGPCQDIPFNAVEWLETITPALRKSLFRLKHGKVWDFDDLPQGKFPESWVTEVDDELAEIKSLLLNEGGLLDENFVFTHGDLHSDNIFVFEETPGVYKVSAIIDWEFSGYCPWWVEWFYNRSGLGLGNNCDKMATEEGRATFSKILSKLWPITTEIGEMGDLIFRHKPNGDNSWHGRPFCKCEPICTWYRSDETFAVKHPHEVTYDVTELYPDQRVEFNKMWNHLVQSEGGPNSLTKKYTGEVTE